MVMPRALIFYHNSMADFARAGFSLHRSHQSFSGQFNVAFINDRCYISQQQHAPTSRNAILAYIVPVLLNLIELKYQGKDDSAFEAYPKTMCFAVTSLLMYCLAYYVELKFSSSHPTWFGIFYARALHHSMVLFGSLTMASLASILFPDPVRPVLYVLCILLSAGELLEWIRWRLMAHHHQGMRVQGSRRVRTSVHPRRLLLSSHAHMQAGPILPL
ncbi:hypothetical protein F0562_012875 [Nyssa sinensis]|uniref:Uncharacterized protein n=1 Tax=Nyssa sinensis TaxID=561372 RepID=A0A5J4ZXQ9_9ASTE|nr:hypothetical protein F0562_012875 [Nyssa sinensis]